MLYPKIGIRPVIDGRWGGVRESLENQTMRMAENAAKLISENLKYPDGTPVQCVIGCTTIGGGAEAARVAEQFSTQNVTATLSVIPGNIGAKVPITRTPARCRSFDTSTPICVCPCARRSN